MPTVTDERRKLLTSGEVARELGVSTMTISRWANAGAIRPAFTTRGGHHRWYLDDVREQLEASRTADDEPPPEPTVPPYDPRVRPDDEPDDEPPPPGPGSPRQIRTNRFRPRS